MIVLFVTSIALPLITIGIGVLAHRGGWSVRGGPSAWGALAARHLGRRQAVAAVCAVGWSATLVVGLGLGLLAKAIEDGVDRPTYDWVHPRVSSGLFTRINEKLTLMGNTAIIELVVMLALIILGCAYKRRWWLPTVAIIGAFVVEKYLQKFLATVVDRGHPPTTLGTYPSGGVGRLLGIYSVIVVLVIMLMPSLSRAWRAGLWTGIATAGVVEAFTRVYLSKHWLTDAAFALVFGALLLLTNIAALAAAEPDVARPDPAQSGDQPTVDRRRSPRTPRVGAH